MTEVRQGPTLRVRFREVSALTKLKRRRELTVTELKKCICLWPRPIWQSSEIFLIQLFPNWTACSTTTYTDDSRNPFSSS